MKSQISPQDYERLSAFLDGELKGAAGREFQARLEVDPGLKAALEDLRNLRALVREMPRRRAPRSFTLTPEMVKARKPAFFALAALRTLQFSAAVSGILLVLVLAGDLFHNRFAARPAFAPAAPAAAVEMAAPPAGAAETNRNSAGTVVSTTTAATAEEYALDQGAAPLATAPPAGAIPAQAPLATGEPAAAKMIPTEEMQALEAAPPGGMPSEAPFPAPETATPELKKGAPAASPIPPALPETARPETPSAPAPFLLIEALLAVILIISITLAFFIRRSITRK